MGRQLVERLGAELRADGCVDLPLVLVKGLGAAAHPLGMSQPFVEEAAQRRLGAAVLAALDGGHQTGQLLLGRPLAGPGLPTVGGIRPAELFRLARDRVPADEDSKLPVAR
jgi:hypothetical protein